MKKEKVVFIINGSGGVGKDEFINMISKTGKIVRNNSSINIVKECALKLGWDGIKDENGRKFLSDLKNLAVRAMDFSFKWDRDTIKEFFDNEDCDDNYLFLHIREVEEIERVLLLKDEFGPIFSILVENDNVEQIITNESDANVKNISYDYIIKNNYTLEILEELAILFNYHVENGTLGIIDYLGEED